jgi:hypothetical protein
MSKYAATSKRDLLRLAAFTFGAACLPQQPAFAADGEKMTKAQAAYQDSPNGIAVCATCTLFVAPHSCKVVDGDVSPNGWCKAYAMAD